MDKRGNYTKYTQVNGIDTKKGFDAVGFPTSSTAPNRQEMEYEFDWTTGNLKQRADNLPAHTKVEAFVYDAAHNNRLAAATVTLNGIPQPTLQTLYDPKGNITQKSDVGSYQYQSPRPNAVTSITNQQTVGLLAQNVSYTTFLLPETIEQDNGSVKITYDGNHQRRKMEEFDKKGEATFTRYYFDNYEWTITETRSYETHYIGGGDGLSAVVVRHEFEKLSTYAIYTDQLGSIKVADDIATDYPRDIARDYDAWGKLRRDADWSAMTQADIEQEVLGNAAAAESWLWLPRGYTGHEHLLEFDIINMNARLYDPTLARMLSSDNVLSDPTNTQSYNRYSYVINNPLKYTDPSGNNPILNGVKDFFSMLSNRMFGTQQWVHHTPGSKGGGGGAGGGGAGAGSVLKGAFSFAQGFMVAVEAVHMSAATSANMTNAAMSDGVSGGAHFMNWNLDGEPQGIRINFGSNHVIFNRDGVFNPNGSKYTGTNSLVNQFKQAIEYLDNSNTAMNVIDRVINAGGASINRAEISTDNGQSGGAISWSPLYGTNNANYKRLRNKNGIPRTGINSPALQLAHEMGHYLNELDDGVRATNARSLKLDPDWSNEEEQHTIEKYDQPIARELNESYWSKTNSKFREDVRITHGGRPIPFNSPISR